MRQSQKFLRTHWSTLWVTFLSSMTVAVIYGLYCTTKVYKFTYLSTKRVFIILCN